VAISVAGSEDDSDGDGKVYVKKKKRAKFAGLLEAIKPQVRLGVVCIFLSDCVCMCVCVCVCVCLCVCVCV
jgi:hypothetical protein